MAAPAVTFDGLNINDGTTYSVLPDGSLGAPNMTFSEYIGYDGTVKTYNASSAHLVEVNIPLMVSAASTSAVRAAIDALNAKIAACTSTSPKTLSFDGVSYSIVPSSQVAPALTQSYQNKFFCFVNLVLNRLP